MRLPVAAIGLALCGLVAGCGEKEDVITPPPPEAGTTAEVQPPPETTPAPGGREEEPVDGTGGSRAPDPEDAEGGAGDEEPIRSPAQITGRGGRLYPSRVRVPPFIAIQVVLVSGDGGQYGLDLPDGQTIKVRGDERRAGEHLEGLRPRGRYVLRAVGTGQRIVVEATAEPGP